ncbi:MAG: hypothetical protein ABI616_12845 [Pseudomonadota bacterium]
MATGRFAGPIQVDFDRATPRAEQWLESKFAPWAAPVLESWAQGAFNDIESVLFTRGEDTSQRLYYYVCELQRRGEIAGPRPMIFDIAQIPRACSLERTIDEVRRLARELGVTDAALDVATAQANRLRAHVAPEPTGPRCLLAGTPAPDDRLAKVIAHAGFVPIGRTLSQQWADLGPPIERVGGDLFAAIGRQLHESKDGPRSFSDPATDLAEGIRNADAKAVVLWRIEEDEAHAWHLPAQRRALDALGVPALVLTRRDWLARDGVSEEINQFLRGIEA